MQAKSFRVEWEDMFQYKTVNIGRLKINYILPQDVIVVVDIAYNTVRLCWRARYVFFVR